MKKFALVVFAALLFAASSSASDPHEFSDAAEAERYRNLVAELRCLVCQNQNLADSNALLARDMRDVVAEMIRAGESDGAVIAFMTERYGDFVLYRPPFKPATWALWLGPLALVLLGLLAIARIVRRPRRAEMGAEEKQRAAKMLEGE